MYNCLIVDDEELARNLIVNHVGQLDDFHVVAVCENAIDASKILQEKQVDLIFLDIEMPVLTGTEFFGNLIHKPKVIFTTAYRDYAIDGFNLNAVDYLLKPITFGRFFQAIEKFRTIMAPDLSNDGVKEQPVRVDHIYVRKDRKQVKVYLDDILYVESVKDYIKIITKDESHLVKFSISAFIETLDDRFFRIHRSFIINSDKISAYTKHDIEIGYKEIPIGESYKDVLTRIKGC